MKSDAKIAQAAAGGNVKRHCGQAALKRLAQDDLLVGIAVGRCDGQCSHAVKRGVDQFEVSDGSARWISANR